MKKKEFCLLFLFVAIDQISKVLVTKFLNSSIPVIPKFFTLSYTENTGAAWSLFSGQRIFLILLSIIALVLLYQMYPKCKRNIEKFFYIVLCSGILGNLIDRIIFGYVKDFLSFQIFGYLYPIFNLADVMIVVGTLVVFINMLWEEKNEIHSRNRRKNKN